MTEALYKVREELGTDAIILSTRSEKQGGVFDFLGRRLVEVTAAVDDADPEKTAPARKSQRETQPISPDEAQLYPPDRPVAYEPTSRSVLPRRPVNINVKDIENKVHVEKLLSDVQDLKNSVKTLADSALMGEMAGLPANLARILTAMLESGMDDRIAKRVVRQLVDQLTGLETNDPETIIRKMVELLISGIDEPRAIALTGAKPRMIAFVGPTGSGKTTTIAKLAADFTLNHEKDVSILTVDTKRVDAVGQLKAYCRILNIPLYIAYSPDELPSVMPGLMKSDITLVDTPGSGPMDKSQMIEMVEFLQKMVPQEVHMVMSVTTSLTEMRRIHDNFSMLKPSRILFTKLDETVSYGPMLSFALTAKKPLSYITFGQNVPGDFAVADLVDIIERNLGKRETFSE